MRQRTDGRKMGDRWEEDGRQMGGRRVTDGRKMGDRWEEDGRQVEDGQEREDK